MAPEYLLFGNIWATDMIKTLYPKEYKTGIVLQAVQPIITDKDWNYVHMLRMVAETASGEYILFLVDTPKVKYLRLNTDKVYHEGKWHCIWEIVATIRKNLNSGHLSKT